MELKVTEILSTKLQERLNLKDKKTSVDFSLTLSKIGEEDLMNKLTGLIDEIAITGKKIVQQMDIKNLKSYRNLISQFINEIIVNSHKLSRENFLDRKGRHRVLGIVKIVNKNLDELAQELLKNEKDNLKILEKTDNIQGLLLDIVL